MIDKVRRNLAEIRNLEGINPFALRLSRSIHVDRVVHPASSPAGIRAFSENSGVIIANERRDLE